MGTRSNLYLGLLSDPRELIHKQRKKIMSINVSAGSGFIGEFFEHLAAEVNENKNKTAANKIERLNEAFEALQVQHKFSPRDVVTWKTGLRNLKLRGPFLVVEHLSEPVITKEISRASAYGEPFDVLVLFVDGDGDVLRTLVNSARIELYKPEEAEEADDEKTDNPED